MVFKTRLQNYNRRNSWTAKNYKTNKNSSAPRDENASFPDVLAELQICWRVAHLLLKGVISWISDNAIRLLKLNLATGTKHKLQHSIKMDKT